MCDFEPIQTDRLLLRRLTLSDAGIFYAYKRLPEAVRFQSWRPQTLDEVKERILDMESVRPDEPGAWLQLAVCRKDTGEMVGDIGMHFDRDDPSQAIIGYTISPSHQRKGYATEAAHAVVGYLFNVLGKRRVTASVDPRNAPSMAVLEKMGFRKEAHFRKCYFVDGEWVDDCIYAVLKEEWDLKPREGNAMKDFLSPRAKALKPYVPGEQPKDKRYIKLNTNENPYPPSPKALEAIARADSGDLRLYTLPEMETLRAAIAQVEGLPGIEWVYCGNGSDEVLALAFQAFFGGDLPLLFPDVTYSFYPVYCDLYGIRYETMPLAPDFTLRLEDYGRPACGAVFPNPNAPTGIYIPLDRIEAYLKKHADRVLLLDEAYVRFGNESAVRLLADYPNLAVVRTLSKSHALAGLRCGIVMAQPHLIDGVIRVKNSFNSYPMSALSQAGATAAILDDEYSLGICRKVAATRDRVMAALLQRGFSVTPSTANLVFFSHPKISGEALYEGLRNRGILVRHFKTPERIRNHVRMSMGTDEEMDVVLAALDDLIKDAGKA